MSFTFLIWLGNRFGLLFRLYYILCRSILTIFFITFSFTSFLHYNTQTLIQFSLASTTFFSLLLLFSSFTPVFSLISLPFIPFRFALIFLLVELVFLFFVFPTCKQQPLKLASLPPFVLNSLVYFPFKGSRFLILTTN